MTIPPVRSEGNANHVPDHNDIRGELITNKDHRDIVAGNPHGTTAAQVGAAAVSHGTHLPTPTMPADDNKIPVVQTNGSYALEVAPTGGGGGSLAVSNAGSSLTTAALSLDIPAPSSLVFTEPTADNIELKNIAPAVKTTVSSIHWPTCTGELLSFGTYQRCYFVPFMGNGMTLDSINVKVDVAHASGTVRFGLYVDLGDGSLSLLNAYTAVGATTTVLANCTEPSQVLNANVPYLIGVVIQGNSTVKIRGTNYVATRQSDGTNTGRFSPSSIYYQDSVSGSLPNPSYAPYSGTATTEGIPAINLGMV